MDEAFARGIALGADPPAIFDDLQPPPSSPFELGADGAGDSRPADSGRELHELHEVSADGSSTLAQMVRVTPRDGGSYSVQAVPVEDDILGLGEGEAVYVSTQKIIGSYWWHTPAEPANRDFRTEGLHVDC